MINKNFTVYRELSKLAKHATPGVGLSPTIFCQLKFEKWSTLQCTPILSELRLMSSSMWGKAVKF